MSLSSCSLKDGLMEVLSLIIPFSTAVDVTNNCGITQTGWNNMHTCVVPSIHKCNFKLEELDVSKCNPTDNAITTLSCDNPTFQTGSS